MKEYRFRLPAGYDKTSLLQALSKKYTIAEVDTKASSHAYLDTFDWRLFKANFALIHDGKMLHLQQLKKLEYSAQLNIAKRPLFVWDLPESDLQQALVSILEMRALLTQADVYTAVTHYQVHNEDEKTVVRLQLDETRPSADNEVPVNGTHLYVTPIRGYDKPLKFVLGCLEDAGGTIINPLDLYLEAMTGSAKNPAIMMRSPNSN